MGIQIVDANPFEPVKVVIYGPEGMGKSTFGAMSDDPIFMPLEPGASRLKDRNGRPVKLMKGIQTWEDILAGVKYLRSEKHSYKTLVVDSASAAQNMAIKSVIKSTGKSIKTVDGGYGAGGARLESMHVELIDKLEDLRLNRDMNIIIPAHSSVKTVKDPSSQHDYDEFELALEKPVANAWKQWIDCQFFVRLTTFTKDTDDKNRARALTDDSLTVFTRKDPAFQAKNRFGMPKQMPFGLDFWDVFMGYVGEGPKDDQDEKEEVEAGQSAIALKQSALIVMVADVADPAKQKQILDYIESNGKTLKDLNAIEDRIKAVIAEQTK